METAKRLYDLAERYRKLAGSLGNRATAETMLRIAAAYARRAAEIEARLRQRSRLSKSDASGP